MKGHTVMRSNHLIVLFLIVLIGSTSVLTGQTNTTESGITRGGLMLFGGIGMPNGSFGKTEGEDAGYAKQGYFGGAELMASLVPSVALVVDGRYIVHKYDDSQIAKLPGLNYEVGSYSVVLPMAGIRLYTTSSLGFFVDAQAGYMFAKSPQLTITGPGVDEKVDAASGKGLAYGASAGLDFGNTLIVGASYIVSKPKFEGTATLNGQQTSRTCDESMNIVQVYAGIRF